MVVIPVEVNADTLGVSLEDIKKLIKNTYSDLMYGTDEKLCPVSKPNNQNNMLNEIELEIYTAACGSYNIELTLPSDA